MSQMDAKGRWQQLERVHCTCMTWKVCLEGVIKHDVVTMIHNQGEATINGYITTEILTGIGDLRHHHFYHLWGDHTSIYTEVYDLSN